MKHLYAIIMLTMLTAVHANDSFYQGGGSSLRPLHKAQMRLIEEKLLIHPMPQPVCYRLRFRGQFVDEWNGNPQTAPDIRSEEFAEIAGLTDCPPGKLIFTDRLLSVWQAQAEYQIEALEDQNNVQMSFPLPVWDTPYYLNREKEWGRVPAPAVANFRIFIDGKLVKDPLLAWLDMPNPVDASLKKALAYVWKVSLKKGEKYTLRAEYDFGANYRTGFPMHENPWFIAGNAVGHDAEKPSLNLLYYLSPLKAWGAQPPQRITIEVRRPPGVPSAFLVPVTPKPACVDSSGLHYEYRNAYPETELQVAMPHWWLLEHWGKPQTWPRLETAEQRQRWRKMLGGEHVPVACREMDEVTPSDDFPCLQERCAGETIAPAIMLPDFKDFPTPKTYTGKVTPPDVVSQPKARMFRTMLRENVKQGVNFAGRYVFASWGCGSGCTDSGIVDAETAQVYFDPQIEAVVNGIGSPEFHFLGEPPQKLSKLDFRPDSSLLFIYGWAEALPLSSDVVSVLTWENHALRLLYTAYGVPSEDMYDYAYNYYARLVEPPLPSDKLKLPVDNTVQTSLSRLLARAAGNRCDDSAAAKINMDPWQPLLPLLQDGLHHAGNHATKLAAELAAKVRPTSVIRDRKNARTANAKGLALLNSEPLKNAWKRLSLYSKDAENVDKKALVAAAKWFEEGVQADPEDPELLTNLGYVYLLQGNPAGLEQLRAALLREPARVSAWVNLGMYLQFSLALFDGNCWPDATQLGNAAFTLSLRLSRAPDKTRAFLRQLVGERNGQDHPLLDFLENQ